jgi:hypothetical protein
MIPKKYFSLKEDQFIWRNRDNIPAINKVLDTRDKYDIHRRIETLEDLIAIYGCSFEALPVMVSAGVERIIMPRVHKRDMEEIKKDYQTLPVMEVVKKHKITRHYLKYVFGSLGNKLSTKETPEKTEKPPVTKVIPVKDTVSAKIIQKPLIVQKEEPDQITLLIEIKNNQREIIILLEAIAAGIKTGNEIRKRGVEEWTNRFSPPTRAE